MQTQNDLEADFQNDINRIVNGLINDYSLRYEQEVLNLSDPLVRWLDFVLRYIPRTPRTILASKKFPKILDVETERALHKLEQLIQNGGDINPYQSKGLILHKDTSGNKRQQRTDLLFADWGVHHFHLTDTPIPNNSYFSDRSDWVLFCMVGSDFIGFIDIKHHGQKDVFSDPDLIKIVAENWPEIMERYKINGIVGMQSGSETYSSEEIDALRKSGLGSILKIGNHFYAAPGMGVTSASTSTRVSMSKNKIRKYVRELAKMVFDPVSQFKTESLASGITNPEYCLSLTKQGMAVYEKSENKAFVLPRATNVDNQNFLAELHDLVVPSWAMNFVISKNPECPH